MIEIVLEETKRTSKLGTSTRHKDPKVNDLHTSRIGEGAAQHATTDKEAGNTKGR